MFLPVITAEHVASTFAFLFLIISCVKIMETMSCTASETRMSVILVLNTSLILYQVPPLP